jgi:hypothetical protein
MPRDDVVVAVYTPTKADLPYLAVMVHPSGKATGVAAKTFALAQEIAEDMGKQAPG